MMKILVADDDEGIVDAVSMMLELYGYEVTSTLDGNKVISLLDPPPDLLILDTWMSGVDGRDVCKAVKNDPAINHIPVLMISASHEIRESAIQAGSDNFIAKPFEMEAFISLVESMLSGTTMV